MSTKNEVKINKISEEIRSELSLALNNWQDIDSNTNSKVKKNPETPQKTPAAKKPKQKTKLLKMIQAQLKTLSL